MPAISKGQSHIAAVSTASQPGHSSLLFPEAQHMCACLLWKVYLHCSSNACTMARNRDKAFNANAKLLPLPRQMLGIITADVIFPGSRTIIPGCFALLLAIHACVPNAAGSACIVMSIPVRRLAHIRAMKPPALWCSQIWRGSQRNSARLACMPLWRPGSAVVLCIHAS